MFIRIARLIGAVSRIVADGTGRQLACLILVGSGPGIATAGATRRSLREYSVLGTTEDNVCHGHGGRQQATLAGGGWCPWGSGAWVTQLLCVGYDKHYMKSEKDKMVSGWTGGFFQAGFFRGVYGLAWNHLLSLLFALSHTFVLYSASSISRISFSLDKSLHAILLELQICGLESVRVERRNDETRNKRGLRLCAKRTDSNDYLTPQVRFSGQDGLSHGFWLAAPRILSWTPISLMLI